jgi:hypothetical protein
LKLCKLKIKEYKKQVYVHRYLLLLSMGVVTPEWSQWPWRTFVLEIISPAQRILQMVRWLGVTWWCLQKDEPQRDKIMIWMESFIMTPKLQL